MASHEKRAIVHLLRPAASVDLHPPLQRGVRHLQARDIWDGCLGFHVQHAMHMARTCLNTNHMHTPTSHALRGYGSAGAMPVSYGLNTRCRMHRRDGFKLRREAVNSNAEPMAPLPPGGDAYEWTPLRCQLPPLDRATVCRRLGGSRVLLVGDSVLQQVGELYYGYIPLLYYGCIPLLYYGYRSSTRSR